MTIMIHKFVKFRIIMCLASKIYKQNERTNGILCLLWYIFLENNFESRGMMSKMKLDKKLTRDIWNKDTVRIEIDLKYKIKEKEDCLQFTLSSSEAIRLTACCNIRISSISICCRQFSTQLNFPFIPN